MAIQDSNPERRNLSILALSIIVFFVADGSFDSNIVRLQIINVEFSKPEVLAYFVWGILAWFTFRYWLVHQGGWKKDFYTELKQNFPKSLFQYYLTKRFTLGSDYSGSHHEDRHWFMLDGEPHGGLSFNHIYNDESGKQNRTTIKAESFLDRTLIFSCTLYMVVRRPTLSGYFTPYFLALWAVGLGAMNAL